MSSPFAAEGVWHPLGYEEAWAPFDDRFQFRGDYYERAKPAISLPPDSLVIDLGPAFLEGPRFASAQAAINASALRAFVWLAEAEDLVALDWQHTPYRYSPAAHALSSLDHWPVPVFPDGDYYAHFPADLAWGTFGHPWQETRRFDRLPRCRAPDMAAAPPALTFAPEPHPARRGTTQADRLGLDRSTTAAKP